MLNGAAMSKTHDKFKMLATDYYMFLTEELGEAEARKLWNSVPLKRKRGRPKGATTYNSDICRNQLDEIQFLPPQVRGRYRNILAGIFYQVYGTAVGNSLPAVRMRLKRLVQERDRQSTIEAEEMLAKLEAKLASMTPEELAALPRSRLSRLLDERGTKIQPI
jgi:hypothetical protein